MILGVVSAVPGEQEGFVEEMNRSSVSGENIFEQFIEADRVFSVGSLFGVDAVYVLSGVGKVAAAITTTLLINKFKVTHVLFTGTAGGACDEIQRGDLVIANSLIQHDVDATVLGFERFQIPFGRHPRMFTDIEFSADVQDAVIDFLKFSNGHAVCTDSPSEVPTTPSISEDTSQSQTGVQTSPKLVVGLIASGDKFITDLTELKRLLPDLKAVEMEGAAVAQVCLDFQNPFSVIRSISDNADSGSVGDYEEFIKIASQYSFGIVKQFCINEILSRDFVSLSKVKAVAQALPLEV